MEPVMEPEAVVRHALDLFGAGADPDDPPIAPASAAWSVSSGNNNS